MRTPALLLAVALIPTPSCGDGAREAAAFWDPQRGGEWQVVQGRVEARRDAYLTRWYGQGSPGLDQGLLLGDERWALVADSPSHIAVDLGAAAQRVLTVSVRRESADDGPPLRAEVFWDAGEGALESLVHRELAGDDDRWHEFRVDLPGTAGTLRLLGRNAHPAMAGQPGARMAWGAPQVAAASRDASDGLPDVVLVTVDTLRGGAELADHMPELHARLAKGAYWPAAVSPSNWTLPSYGSLFTGLDPAVHGAGRGDFAVEPGPRPDYTALDPSAHSFVQVMRDAGYATCMVHQNPFLEPWTGLSRGFDRYLRVVDDLDAGGPEAEDWWSAHAHRPRLLVIHLFAPHLPYRAPVPEGADPLPPNPLDAMDVEHFLATDHTPQQRRDYFDLDEAQRTIVRDHYWAEVAALDRALEERLRVLLDADDGREILFAFHSDHGEELWDAGSFEHGHGFDDSVIRVPLGLVWPGRVDALHDDRPIAAQGLGLEILRLIGLRDPRMPEGGLLGDDPLPARSSYPLYRADTGGREFAADGQVVSLPFTRQGSGGVAPTLDEGVLRRLAELGYASEDGQ